MTANGRSATNDDHAVVKIDLHLHSHASGTATNWWVKSLGLGFETRESYTPPAEAYRMAKQAGMDFVTLTDHETVDGAVTLTDRPDFLVGEEVSATFPEDGSWVDVLVYGLDADDHREIQARRHNVYQLTDYLNEAGLVYALAHPMFALGAPLDRDAVEKRLVLFRLWEFVNGSRPAEQNRLTRDVASGVGPGELRQLARKHALTIPAHRSIAGIAGSDDHGGVYVGSTATVLPKVSSVADLLAALAAGEVATVGADGSVDRMALTGFKIAGAAYAEAEKTRAADVAAEIDGRPPLARSSPTHGEAAKLLEYLPLLASLDGSHIRSVLAGQYERRIAAALGNVGSGIPVLSLLSSLGSFVDGHLFVAPYVATHGYFGRERHKTRVLRRLLFAGRREDVKVGVFVDHMDDIHGVATMYKNVQRLAAEPRPDRLQIVRCGDGSDDASVQLPPIASLPMPLYDGMTLGVPSLLDVLDHMADEGYDVIQVAAPGPLGLAAMIAASTLGVPIVGAYHTEFGAYARVLSGDALVAEIVEALVREFYERCAVVAVSSASTALALEQRGYRIGRFEVLKNGVDTTLFHPNRRDDGWRAALGGGRGRTLLLYAGRVSREKGLERLAERYLALRQRRDDAQLVIAGDGPFRRDLERMLGETATFTGFLRGDELAQTFASCDIFVFPSTTDTLGRAVAEAQASGLPAVVFGMGGPKECIRPGESGFVVDPDDDAAFFSRVEDLLDLPGLRQRMGRAGRQFAETLSWDNVLDGLIALYREVAGMPAEPDVRVAPSETGPDRAAPAAARSETEEPAFV